MQNDKDSILAIHHAWINAEQAGDVEAMLSLCAADIRLFPPSNPSKQGKDAVRESLLESSDSTIDLDVSNIYIEISGILAYKTASFVARVEQSDGSAVKTVQGSHLWVLRREGSDWLITIVAWSAW
jgi:ketosteroid isomerase-like protein